MAEGKKSFIAYCDWEETFNELPDEKAGQLIKHLMAYVNDRNPKTDDVLINAVFASIRQTLKRDLKKYENFVEKQRLNGMKGGRPKAKKPKPLSGNPTKPKKADSDSDSDSDSVSVVPTLKDFISYAKTLKAYKPGLDYSLEAKFNQWIEAGWKDGNGNKIKNWKTKIQNTIPYLKEVVTTGRKHSF